MGTKTVSAGDEGLTYSPTTLTDGVTSVTITYVDGGASATCTTAVSVTHTLTSIAVTTQPTTRSYEYGDSFSTSGMVVTATYSDNATAIVTSSCTISPANGATLSTVGTQTISISYKDSSVSSAKTTSTTVTVARKSVPAPTWKSSSAPTYTGSSINVASSTFWNNWNTTYFSYSGCSASGAGTHTATFTPNSNYRWTGGSTSATNVDWTIKQKAPSFSVSPTTIAISASNYSSGVSATITYDGDGTLSAVSSDSNVASVTGSGTKNLTIKGNGSTAGSATITISATAGTNYSKPSDITISVTATYWSFGDGNGEAADAAWFAGLKSYLASNAADTAWVGKTKTVTLTSAVSGSTTTGSNTVNWDTGWTSGSTVQLTIIGVNHDASNTVTFQTTNGSPTLMKFSAGTVASPKTSSYDENATKWGNAACCARDACAKFYDAFPGKASIKQVTKLTNTVISGTSMGSTQDYVWLPSYDEVGLGSYQYAPAGDEFTSGGTQSAYAYYTSDATRIKKQGDSGSAVRWWLRSRNTYAAYVVGIVNGSGQANYSNYWYTRCLAPAFVIGN